MAAIDITIEDKQLSSLFDKLISKTSDLSPCMRNIAMIMKETVLENFDRGGRPQSWVPSRRVREEGGQTLILKGMSGGLMGSITSKSDKTAAIVGTNKDYAELHQFGGRILNSAGEKAAKVPARPFLVIPDEELQEIMDTILDYLKI
jgi:phage virion morphogenesis protein